MNRPTFYYDLGSPYAYLSAERISGLFTEAGLEQPEWQPILLGGIFQHFGRDSWGNGHRRAEGMAEVERRASAYGLPPIAWPDPWPGNTLTVMRVGDLRQADRPHRLLLPRRLPPGLRRRPRPDRPRQRADRRRRLRAAPQGAAESGPDRQRQERSAGSDRPGGGARGRRRPRPRRRRGGLLGGRPTRGRPGGCPYLTPHSSRCRRAARPGPRTDHLMWPFDARSSRRRHLLRAAGADGADPALRGRGRAPVPASESRRLPAPGDRRGGDDRRHHLGDARRGLPDRRPTAPTATRSLAAPTPTG